MTVCRNRQLAGDDAALTQAYEGLDAVSACLENHYLQQPGAASIAASPDWATLRQTLHSSRVELQLRLDESSMLRLDEAGPAAATVTPNRSPVWCGDISGASAALDPHDFAD